MRATPTLVALLVTLIGCRPVPEAPEDVDGLMHHFWQKVGEGEDGDIAQGVVNLHAAVDGDSVEDAVDGQVTNLDADEIALVGSTADPSEAPGIYMVDPIACDLETVDDIVIALHQGELYDTFDDYVRTYTSDEQAYSSREVATLTWDVEYSVTVPLAGSYTAKLNSGARWVAELPEDLSPFGPLLITWSTLAEPAEVDTEDGVFDQDYRVEVYYEPEAGRVLHAEAIWRHMEIGVMSFESEDIQRLVLNGLADWDDETEAICADGGP
jgi:hypothetical protein